MNTIPIIYENSEIIIINKPFGLSVQGGVNISSSVDTVLPLQLGYKVFLVHRLDKETAGLLVVAKSAKAANKWTALLNSGNVKKEYLALSIGKQTKKSGTFKDTILNKGKEQSAVTHFSVVDTFTKKIDSQTVDFTLFSLKLETGRMHQIRIHLNNAGFPIVADDKHGNFKSNKFLQKTCKFKKLMLVAYKLTILLDGKQTEFSIPYPEHLEKALVFLGEP